MDNCYMHANFITPHLLCSLSKLFFISYLPAVFKDPDLQISQTYALFSASYVTPKNLPKPKGLCNILQCVSTYWNYKIWGLHFSIKNCMLTQFSKYLLLYLAHTIYYAYLQCNSVVNQQTNLDIHTIQLLG